MINRSKAIATVDRRSSGQSSFPAGRSGTIAFPAQSYGLPPCRESLCFPSKGMQRNPGEPGRKKASVQLLICKAGKPVTG